jgi:hypothetical protein
LEVVFSTRAVQRGYKKTTRAIESVLYGSLWRKESVGREPTLTEDISTKAEESPLLEAVTREQLVKTQQAGKDLPCAVVICEVWTLAMALYLLVVPSCVYMWSINPIIQSKTTSRVTSTLRDNIKTSARDNLGYYELKRHTRSDN